MLPRVLIPLCVLLWRFPLSLAPERPNYMRRHSAPPPNQLRQSHKCWKYLCCQNRVRVLLLRRRTSRHIPIGARHQRHLPSHPIRSEVVGEKVNDACLYCVDRGASLTIHC